MTYNALYTKGISRYQVKYIYIFSFFSFFFTPATGGRLGGMVPGGGTGGLRFTGGVRSE